MLYVRTLFYIDVKQVSSKESRVAFASNERAARENMRDDKIYHLVSARSIVHSLALVCPEIGGCQGKGLHNAHRDPRGRGGTREKRKVDRDKADAIITIFFTRAVFPAGNYTDPVDEAPRRVTPLTRSGFRLRIVRHSHSIPRHSASEIPPRFWTTDENYTLDD